MTDQSDTSQSTDSDPPAEDSPVITELRKKAKRAEEAEQRAAEAEARIERMEAFSGVPLPDTKMAELFRDTYKGDMTAEAVMDAAKEYGLIEPEPEATPPAEQAQLGAMQQAAQGQPLPVHVDEAIQKLNELETADDIADFMRGMGLGT